MRAQTSLRAFWRPAASSDGLIDESPLKAYWRAYGGARAIWHSAYLWIAVALNIALMPLWCGGKITDIALSTLPNLLGFSIGGVAIVLAFPTGNLMKTITDSGSGDSYYMDLASRLVHFVVVQVIAICVALMAKSYPFSLSNFFAGLLFLYALLTALAAGLSLFGIAKIYNFSGGSSD